MFETDTWYGLEILQQCGKGVKSKSHKVFSNVSRDCRGKTGWKKPFWPSHEQNCSNLAVGLHDIVTLGYNYEKLIKEP